jgi:hypothetical protein
VQLEQLEPPVRLAQPEPRVSRVLLAQLAQPALLAPLAPLAQPEQLVLLAQPAQPALLAQLEASPLVERAPTSTAKPPFLELSIGRWKALEQHWSA